MKPLCALLLAVVPLSAAESLFDGKTLNHWSGKAEHWRVEDGAITGEIPGTATGAGSLTAPGPPARRK